MNKSFPITVEINPKDPQYILNDLLNSIDQNLKIKLVTWSSSKNLFKLQNIRTIEFKTIEDLYLFKLLSPYKEVNLEHIEF